MANSITSASGQHLRPDEVERITAGVGGWFGPLEGRLLYDLSAQADPAGCIVEIGSWEGKSTIWLAAGSTTGRGAPVISIDPHTGTHLRAEGETTAPTLRRNLERAGVSDHVEMIVATSEEVATGWNRPVSLLWIDGNHEYESARQDVLLWEPHLLPDATVALHDTFVLPGPERVVRELLIGTRRYTSFVHAETTTAARRCNHLNSRAAMTRRAQLARRAFYGVRLRAYDRNTLKFASIRDALIRR